MTSDLYTRLTSGLGCWQTGNVTTGPQPGSPGSPRALLLTKAAGSVTLYWENGVPGHAPIQGYIVEAKREGGRERERERERGEREREREERREYTSAFVVIEKDVFETADHCGFCGDDRFHSGIKRGNKTRWLIDVTYLEIASGTSSGIY